MASFKNKNTISSLGSLLLLSRPLPFLPKVAKIAKQPFPLVCFATFGNEGRYVNNGGSLPTGGSRRKEPFLPALPPLPSPSFLPAVPPLSSLPSRSSPLLPFLPCATGGREGGREGGRNGSRKEEDFLQRNTEEINPSSLPEVPEESTEKENRFKKTSFSKREGLPFTLTGLFPFSLGKEKVPFPSLPSLPFLPAVPLLPSPSVPLLPFRSSPPGGSEGVREVGREVGRAGREVSLLRNFTGAKDASKEVNQINPNFSVPEGNVSEGLPPNLFLNDLNVNKTQFESIKQKRKLKNEKTFESTKPTGSYFGFADAKTSRNSTKTKGLSKGQEVVSITYEEIGLFPRSFSRVLDRFLKQLFSDVENLVIQEYRFYRYLFLTTLKCLLILFFVPFFVNILAKTYIVRPLTEYFWNTKQTEIFLNSYQQKRAFSELKEFEEKTYFESLIFPKSVFKPNLHNSPWVENETSVTLDSVSKTTQTPSGLWCDGANVANGANESKTTLLDTKAPARENESGVVFTLPSFTSGGEVEKGVPCLPSVVALREGHLQEQPNLSGSFSSFTAPSSPSFPALPKVPKEVKEREEGEESKPAAKGSSVTVDTRVALKPKVATRAFTEEKEKIDEYKQTESLINSYTMKSSLFVYQTQEADKNIQQRYQEKTIELAQRYNDQSIEAITNFFADLISLFTLFYLLYVLEIQINITKSFLLEVFFGLDDSKKSLLILLITDLLVGYHSSNLWELFFEFLFHHYGLPESQTGIFLLVATLPVLLDVLFKYLIFRHLNRSSPATVATYHAMIE